MVKHPLNKYQRKLIGEKKHKFENEKKGTLEAQRPTKIWRKLSIEQIKDEETRDDLREALIAERRYSTK